MDRDMRCGDCWSSYHETEDHDRYQYTPVMPFDNLLQGERTRMIEIIKSIQEHAYSTAEKIADALQAEGYRVD